MKFYELFDKKYLVPIRKYDYELNNWQSINIIDSKEKLVSLKDIDSKIIVCPQYYIKNVKGAYNDCKIREGLVSKLINIAHKLPDGYYLLVWDSFRTVETQQSLFDKYYNEFRENTGLIGDELFDYTRKFVSVPSIDRKCPSPHNTGGAIDLTICDENMNSINLGTYFDDFREESYTCFYEDELEKYGMLANEDVEILYNRRILCNLFSEEGFVNYPYEIWHKSYGDQMSSKLLGKDIAIYGGVE